MFGFEGAEKPLKTKSKLAQQGFDLERRHGEMSELSALAGSEGYGACVDDAPLAQLVEQLTLNQWVPGSSP